MKYYYRIKYYARKLGGATLYESNLLFDNYDNACLFAHKICKKYRIFFSIEKFMLV